MAESEGVIKFDLVFKESPTEKSEALNELLQWRDVFYGLGAIGQKANRYEGCAFGNISCRFNADDSFLISGTQTGRYEKALPEHFTCVDSFDISNNRIIAHGPIKPSSESLTHAAIYALNPDIRCIVHGHIPQIWNSMDALKIPSTPVDAAYGTPEMAQAIARLYEENGNPQQAVFGMLGHEDGIIAYGEDFGGIEKLLRSKLD